MTASPVPDFHLRRMAMTTKSENARSICLELVEARVEISRLQSFIARADQLLLNFDLLNCGFRGNNLDATRAYLRERGVTE